MLKIIEQYDYEAIYDNSWGQALVILNEIEKAGKERSLMNYLEDVFPNGVGAIELNDFLSYDWQEIYSHIGMPLD